MVAKNNLDLDSGCRPTIELMGKHDLFFDEMVPYLVEVNVKNRDQYLKIKETLSRTGIAKKKDGINTVYQTCHIVKMGKPEAPKYYICHFKVLFMLDGGVNDLTQLDIGRQNKIIALLSSWGFLTIKCPNQVLTPMCSVNDVTVVRYGQKHLWDLRAKYSLSSRKWGNK